MTTDSTLTLERLAREHLPEGLSIDPDPTARRPFGRYNVVATFDHVEGARKALASEESSGTPQERLSLLLLAGTRVTAPGEREAVGPDPEGVTGNTAKRIVPGVLIGVVVGAGAVAVGAGVLGSLSGGELAAAAAGGAGLGGAVGGMVTAFSGFGDSDAYRHTFTDLREGVTLLALHSDDATLARDAEKRIGAAGATRVWVLDANGRPARLPGG